MNCAIVQPSYLPWKGYFHLIEQSDVFVFYDDVQFDKHGWRNRNRVKTAQGLHWLTVPVLASGNVVTGLPINNVQIADDHWPARHLSTVEQSYARAPFVDMVLDLLRPHLLAGHELLADLAIELTQAIAASLGLERRFVRSSELAAEGDRVERLIRVNQAVGATRYISGPSARSYLDEAQFEEAGIEIAWMEYRYPEYEQLHGPYESQVSVIDLLAMTGAEAPRWIWGDPAS